MSNRSNEIAQMWKSSPISKLLALLPPTRAVLAALLTGVVLAAGGCGPVGEEQGQGPGHRPQVLALNPRQEMELGRRAYREILSEPEKYGRVFPADSPETERVRAVAARIIKATEIRPLEQEMNLHPGRFDWEVNVLESPQINAFCPPGARSRCSLACFKSCKTTISWQPSSVTKRLMPWLITSANASPTNRTVEVCLACCEAKPLTVTKRPRPTISASS